MLQIQHGLKTDHRKRLQVRLGQRRAIRESAGLERIMRNVADHLELARRGGNLTTSPHAAKCFAEIIDHLGRAGVDDGSMCLVQELGRSYREPVTDSGS